MTETGNAPGAKIVLDNSELFDLIINNLPVGFFAVDENMRIIEFNPYVEDVTGIKRSDAIGQKCSEIFQNMLCDAICPFGSSESHKRPLIAKQAEIVNKDGENVPILFTVAPLLDENGGMLGGIVMFREISESQQLEKHRKILISMFAHDLKAPVAIAGGFLARLLKGKAGELNPKQKEYIDVVDQQIKRLDTYIHSFLDILRMEAGQIVLSLVPCSMDKALNELIDGFRMEASKKNIKLELKVPDKLSLIMADKDLLQRVVSNLLDNAIKYSPENSTIYVRVREKEDAIECEVQDSGPGISPNDLPYIFDPFFRGKRDKAESAESGLGLGLAIVKSIVDAHGGRVKVSSREGEGTKFTFALPKNKE